MTDPVGVSEKEVMHPGIREILLPLTIRASPL